MAVTADDGATPDAEDGASVRLFDHEPSLLRHVDPATARELREHATVPCVELEPGTWHPPLHRSSARQWLGLLVLDGYLARPVMVGTRRIAELVGPGDLVRPWDATGWERLVSPRRAWSALTPVRLALLDQRFGALAGRSVPLINELLGRSLRRAYQVAAAVAVADAPTLGERVEAVALYARARWGDGPDEGPLPDGLSAGALAVVLDADRGAVAAELERLAAHRRG